MIYFLRDAFEDEELKLNSPYQKERWRTSPFKSGRKAISLYLIYHKIQRGLPESKDNEGDRRTKRTKLTLMSTRSPLAFSKSQRRAFYVTRDKNFMPKHISINILLCRVRVGRKVFFFARERSTTFQQLTEFLSFILRLKLWTSDITQINLLRTSRHWLTSTHPNETRSKSISSVSFLLPVLFSFNTGMAELRTISSLLAFRLCLSLD